MSLSKRNKRGFFAVLFVLLVVSYTPRLIQSMDDTPEFKFTHEQLLKAEEEINAKEKKSKKYAKYVNKKKKKREYKRLPQMTDPNGLTKQDWMNLGVSEKQAESILRFSERGLKSNEDLKKIYVLPKELYILICDSLYYPNVKNEDRSEKNISMKNAKEKDILIELNEATQDELETIPGIGPFFAKNIIKRRDELGGFYRKEQLLEIWKFDQKKYDEIQKFVEINSAAISKININLATIDELKNHPYISYKVANSIVKMREMRSGYKNLDEIQESKLISEELYNKLLPYITI